MVTARTQNALINNTWGSHVALIQLEFAELGPAGKTVAVKSTARRTARIKQIAPTRYVTEENMRTVSCRSRRSIAETPRGSERFSREGRFKLEATLSARRCA